MEEESVFTGKAFGIITDAKEWYFMECSLDNQDRLRFKLSKPVTVVYDSKNMGDNVERVLGHIAWLLEEVQKPDSDSQSEERVQGAQHRQHSTSWYKDVKKLEDIVSKKDAYARMMESSFLKYGTTKNQKSLFLKGYKKLRSSLIKHPKVSISYNQ
ncbi:hypothetical protein RhiirA1_443329 [Rhizophagus irregularis]|uniref:Uncharacterized protein n=1 Tax=Rhizophagus irregularis TaxID=588596 RepID=A0A2N0RJH5_9GLOM|nr:hypothetical protein RhiirA1_443329 [Rhizophagus irregularis]